MLPVECLKGYDRDRDMAGRREVLQFLGGEAFLCQDTLF